MNTTNNISDRRANKNEPPLATILVVDDQPTLVKGVALRLRLQGYQVLTAFHGQEALETMTQSEPDLIISDVMMPEMDGYDFFQAVRNDSRWVGIPFIFLSAKGAEDDVRYGKLLGAEEYITKPFKPEDLQVAIEARLRRAKELKEFSLKGLDDFKRQFLHVLSHEFKTPLTYISLATELLMNHGGQLSTDELHKLADSIRQGETRLSGLIDNILAVAAIDSGLAKSHFQAECKPYSLLVPLQGAIDRCQAVATKAEVHLHFSPLPASVLVNGLETFLRTALIQLINNAIKFSPPEGKVVVTAHTTNDQVAITFEDQGSGIVDSELPRLFDRFYQVNREQTEQQGGGLGLTIAQAYVELHGGNIEVESKVNEGSIFTVWLPITSLD